MKFGKRLQRLLEDSLPEWRDKFISYKLLKQSLNMIMPTDNDDPLCFSRYGCNDDAAWPCFMPSGCPPEQLGPMFCRRLGHAEENFIALLFAEIEKMNAFFMEKEEEFVIRLQETKGKLEKLQEIWGSNLELSQEIIEVRKAIVSIHGEMVLLENYSALNYTGLVKIIKKHDKRTGGVLRMPFIQSVLQEPFFATDIISKLVQECEGTLQFLFPHSSFNRSRSSSNGIEKPLTTHDRVPAYSEVSEVFIDDDDVMRLCRNTMAAWHIMRELRKGSSTYNLFSVPPFGSVEFDDGPCCKSAIAEQVCWYPEIPVGSNI
ncbi:hypothetical protein GOP47_0003545 [Adiantum capillus-veneris]|uniref:SPX domain-containing protein n=1 Tax=Adiantum capillus-veneris TaxID=13818 RepID=A0A9D4VE76_ADICA|nr:hypothetical protein GOP47_0003153 [Adiantum capillus-veneris]KAI5083802.1 hypothetical protein GOP47_0003545 [Adiantum capillus-veneris]